MTSNAPGLIGDFAETRIKTSTGLLTRMLENRERMSTKWRGSTKKGGGFAADVTPPLLFRGTTKQTCGLNPFVLGNSVPRVGAPMGVHYDTNEPVGCDPLSWVLAGMIGNPSVAFMSAPAAGKSTAMRVMMRGLAAHGVINLIIGDIKNEHGQTIEADGGLRIPVSPGRGTLNVLDPGNIHEALELVESKLGGTSQEEKVREALLADMHVRRMDMVCALIAIHRGSDADGVEETIVDLCLREMYEKDPARVPILSDLLDELISPSEALLTTISPRRDIDEKEKRTKYFARLDDLLTDLAAICRSGTYGAMFNGPTSVVGRDGNLTGKIDYEKGLAFDISGINPAQTKLMAAAYLVTWLVSFGIIETSHTLADAGIAPRRQFMAWMDEFWQPLKASKGMVDRTDRVGRTNRTIGVGTAIALHTMNDLKTLPDEEDRNKAIGMIDRCGMQWYGGLPRNEVERISASVVKFSGPETDQLVEWHNPAFEEEDGVIPGRGCFLIKRGEQLPGIPVRVMLTEAEIAEKIHDTSKRLNTAI